MNWINRLLARMGVPAGASLSVDLATLRASQLRIRPDLVFWSEGKVQVQLDAAGVTVTLPDIVVEGIPAGATPQIVKVMYKYRMIENKYAGINKLNGATVALTSQVIQVRDDSPSAYVDAINYVDDYHTLADGAREGGDVEIGSLNVASTVDEDDTYELRFLLGKADQDFINFDDLQVGFAIWLSV